MKKFMKICAIIALVLVVIGTALAMIGGTITGRKTIKNVVEAVTGGRVIMDFDFTDDVREPDWDAVADNSGNVIGEAVGDAVGEVGSSIGEGIAEVGASIGEEVLDNIDDQVHYNVEDSMNFDKQYEVRTGDIEKYSLGNNVSELDIEVGGCYFEIVDSGDDNFYVEARNINNFQSYVRNGELHVKGSNASLKWNEGDDNYITLYVPANYHYSEVDIEFGAGIMNTGDLSATSVSLEVGAGQINAGYITADELDLSVGMGDMTVAGVQAQKLDGEVDMGHLYVEATVNMEVDLECSMGKLEALLDGNQNDFNYTVECGVGKINIGSNSYTSIAKESYINNGGSKRLKAECAMGEVNVSFTQ